MDTNKLRFYIFAGEPQANDERITSAKGRYSRALPPFRYFLSTYF